ncbi:TPM domain-containing protein [Streptomyces netropsis]|uniref:TPM domain-containing protein n=1 Tax=Streptomyces netropsis TaxID=55404 RepID=UPI0037A55331
MTQLSRRDGPRAAGWAVVGALLALCALLLPPMASARADTPLDLDSSGRITDTVGALGQRRHQVEAALDRLHAEHRMRLYVTYVRDFSGRDGHDWADATADRNGLGPRDVLLAVGTHVRRYAVSAATDSGFRQDQLSEVADTAIAPAVKGHDWAGAAIGAADGYRAVLRGERVRAPVVVPGNSDPGGGLVPGQGRVWLPTALAAGACLAGLYLCARRAGRRRAARRPPVIATSTPPGLARMAQPLTSLPELDAEAARNLVGTDDAVRTSAEELLFARAQLGVAVTRRFAEAVAYARGELADAFRLQQWLDDNPYEDEELRRHALDEICSRCTSANRRLDAESEAFDRLRAIRVNGAGILARAEAAAKALPRRLDAAEAALAVLVHRCVGSAIDTVARHPAEARDRLAFATAALAEARGALADRDADRAAISLRAAEAALSQARTLATAVLRRAGELTGATARLRAALADAKAVSDPGGAAGLDRRTARATEVLAEAEREMATGRYDPGVLLRRVEESAALLDAVSGMPPGRSEQRRRARLARAMPATRGEVAAARDFISTHRGAIGSRARTRLAEAERHLALADSLAGTAGPAALRETGEADSLARQARALAEHDVGSYGTPYDPATPRPTRALGGALLGGIILAGLLPASFGGGATRGRLAG